MKTLAVYGCSCTFGHAIRADETFCSALQATLPQWRVENHGVPGYGTTQTLIQLRRISRWTSSDAVTFCWIPHHLFRNIADPAWLQRLTEGVDGRTRDREYQFPRARLNGNGELSITWIKFPRRELSQVDLSTFRPDIYYLETLCVELFRHAAKIVHDGGGHFFVTILLGRPSNNLQKQLRSANIDIVDASVTGSDFTCLPDDHHPNAAANVQYATKILNYLANCYQISGEGLRY